MADPVGDIIGDYRGFAAMQHERLLARGIDIRPYPLSHLAFRVPDWDQYVHLRTLLERHATANLGWASSISGSSWARTSTRSRGSTAAP